MRFASAIVAVVCFGLGAATVWLLSPATHLAFAEASFDKNSALPLWARPACRAPTAKEAVQDAAALNVLNAFQDAGPLPLAAIAHFGFPWERTQQDLQRTDGPEPCIPEGAKQQIVKFIERTNAYKGLLSDDEIGLSEQLGPGSTKVLQALAQTAFSGSEGGHSGVVNDSFNYDLRPHARMVLAEFGESAQPWGKAAIAQMSADTNLGTGAAMVAVASGEAEALPTTSQLMQNLLASIPKGGRIDRTKRNRLYELAYALGMAGKKAQPYAKPIADLLDRKVASAAPPFGLIDAQPVRMCAVAVHIGGQIEAAALRHDFCRNSIKTFEQ